MEEKMKRLCEYFEYDKPRSYGSYSSTPPVLYPQERDWTCSVACIRTILSALDKKVPSENEFIDRFGLVKGPHYTEEICKKQMFGSDKKVVSSLDYDTGDINLKLLNNLLKQKYFVMAECLYNYAHWVVIVGYFAVKGARSREEHTIAFFEPYYNEIRLVRADEFETMWCDAEGHCREFIAVKR